MTDTDTLTGSMAGLAETILGDGQIGAQDVVELRRHTYKDGSISTEEAGLLLHLYGAASERHEDFDRMFIEALDDYFLVGEGLKLDVRSDAVSMLRPHFTASGAIPDRPMFELVIRLIDRGANCPQELFAAALQALEDHVLNDSRSVFAGSAGDETIDDSDVALIRKIVYGPGGEDGMFIAQREAELLFALHKATAGKDNAPAWQETFVKGVTAYLLQAGETPGRLDAGETEWLANHLPAMGAPHANELALLSYVRQIASSLDPAGEALLAQHGV